MSHLSSLKESFTLSWNSLSLPVSSGLAQAYFLLPQDPQEAKGMVFYGLTFLDEISQVEKMASSFLNLKIAFCFILQDGFFSTYFDLTLSLRSLPLALKRVFKIFSLPLILAGNVSSLPWILSASSREDLRSCVILSLCLNASMGPSFLERYQKYLKDSDMENFSCESRIYINNMNSFLEGVFQQKDVFSNIETPLLWFQKKEDKVALSLEYLKKVKGNLFYFEDVKSKDILKEENYLKIVYLFDSFVAQRINASSI